MKKTFKLFFFVLFTLSLFRSFSEDSTFAKKKIIRRSLSGISSGSNRLIITPRLRSDRRALIISFSNLNVASSFSYELSYGADGIPQGVAGTVTPAGETSTQRELLFGTCSKNVCRYHSNISEMKFTVISTTKSGIRVRKSFKVRV